MLVCIYVSIYTVIYTCKCVLDFSYMCIMYFTYRLIRSKMINIQIILHLLFVSLAQWILLSLLSLENLDFIQYLEETYCYCEPKKMILFSSVKEKSRLTVSKSTLTSYRLTWQVCYMQYNTKNKEFGYGIRIDSFYTK